MRPQTAKSPRPFDARSFRRSLRERFFLRFHMTLILGAVVAAGVVANRMLFDIGVISMLPRYLLAVTLSYGVFFVTIRLWLAWIDASRLAHGRRSSRIDADGGELVADGIEIGADVAVDAGSGGGEGGGLIDGLSGLDDGLILVLLGLVLLLVFGAGVYLLWEAPFILGEAALQFVLASALARRAKQLDQGGWMGSVFRATRLPFFGVLFLAVVVALAARSICPDAVRLTEAIPECRTGLEVGNP